MQHNISNIFETNESPQKIDNKLILIDNEIKALPK